MCKILVKAGLIVIVVDLLSTSAYTHTIQTYTNIVHALRDGSGKRCGDVKSIAVMQKRRSCVVKTNYPHRGAIHCVVHTIWVFTKQKHIKDSFGLTTDMLGQVLGTHRYPKNWLTDICFNLLKSCSMWLNPGGLISGKIELSKGRANHANWTQS